MARASPTKQRGLRVLAREIYYIRSHEHFDLEIRFSTYDIFFVCEIG